MITRRETADDDDVFPKIRWNGRSDALQHGAGGDKFYDFLRIHSGLPLVAGKDLRNSSA